MSEDPRRGMTAIRWINDACYEIRLPDGREVLIDPYIDESPNHVLHMDAEGADYVLISHTHFDHVLSLGTIVERFEPQIFGSLRFLVGSGRDGQLGREVQATEPGEYHRLEVPGVPEAPRGPLDGLDD